MTRAPASCDCCGKFALLRSGDCCGIETYACAECCGLGPEEDAAELAEYMLAVAADAATKATLATAAFSASIERLRACPNACLEPQAEGRS